MIFFIRHTIYAIRHTKPQSGFTLTELIVVIAIMGILSGIGFVVFRPGGQELALDRAAHQIAQDIRRTISFSLETRPDPGICPTMTPPPHPNEPTHLIGFGFRPIVSSNSYEIYAYCQKQRGGIGTRYQFVVPMETVQPERGIQISEIRFANNNTVNAARITFHPPDPTIRMTNDENHFQIQEVSPQVQITLQREGDANRMRTVTVTNNGVIAIQ